MERRGRRSTGRPKKLPSKVEEDLLAEVQRLRAENALPKKLASLGFGRRATPAQKAQVVQKLRHEYLAGPSAHNRSTSSCDLLLPSEADERFQTNTRKPRQKLPRFTTRTKDGTGTAVSQLNYTTHGFSHEPQDSPAAYEGVGAGLPCQNQEISFLQGRSGQNLPLIC